MMSSSRRKHRTIASSRRSLVLLLLASGAFVWTGGAACRRNPNEPFLTYFNGQHNLSVRYPFGWKTESAEQDGIWYRYFLSPPKPPENRPELSVTLLAGELKGTLDEYAQIYLAGNPVTASRDEMRAGAKGRSWRFTSKSGSMHHSLLLVARSQRVYGLYAQGAAQPFAAFESVIVEMERSLNLETTQLYPVVREAKEGYAISIPPTWRESRRLSGQGMTVVQYTSPALGADRDRQTVHAALTITVEPLKAGAGIEEFYASAMAKHGDTFLVISHEPWRGGYVDFVRTESSMSSSGLRRFYRIDGTKAYTLSFEGRDDVFNRVSPWCDLIASTFKVGAEVTAQ